jgi:hypothetical protein
LARSRPRISPAGPPPTMHVLVRTFVMALPSVLQLICLDHGRID